MMLRKTLAAFGIAFCVLAAMVIGGTTASATGTSCTFHPGGRVCNTVHGSGARVDSVVADRRNYDIRNVYACDYSADISVLDGRNQAHVKYFAHPGHAGCTFGAYWSLTQQVHRVFACGDVVSVRWYDRDGVSGYANKKLC